MILSFEYVDAMNTSKIFFLRGHFFEEMAWRISHPAPFHFPGYSETKILFQKIYLATESDFEKSSTLMSF